MTRAEWTKQILAELEGLWEHYDSEPEYAGMSAEQALTIARQGAAELAMGRLDNTRQLLYLAAALLTTIREANLEHGVEMEKPQ